MTFDTYLNGINSFSKDCHVVSNIGTKRPQVLQMCHFMDDPCGG